MLAATVQVAETTRLHWLPVRRSLDAVDLVTCREQLADPALPTVVVLDNAAFHRARLVREALRRLWNQRVSLSYLPPYSPELNDIERLFRTIKHHDLPERTSATFDALQEAVHAAFLTREAVFHRKPANQPRLAA